MFCSATSAQKMCCLKLLGFFFISIECWYILILYDVTKTILLYDAVKDNPFNTIEISLRGIIFAVSVNHLATTYHQSYLVYIHYPLLHLSIPFHLGYLLQVRSFLNILGVSIRLDNRKCANCAFHPYGHRLHSDQLPVV